MVIHIFSKPREYRPSNERRRVLETDQRNTQRLAEYYRRRQQWEREQAAIRLAQFIGDIK